MLEDYIKKVEKENRELNIQVMFLNNKINSLECALREQRYEAAHAIEELKRLRVANASISPDFQDARRAYNDYNDFLSYSTFIPTK